jgi:starvation-inducible outer membrane lipoprotein
MFGTLKYYWNLLGFAALITVLTTILTGCTTVHSVISDPNVQSAALATAKVATTAVVMSNPEIAGIAIAVSALATAAGALYKAVRKPK